jgi:hypothetical protein
MNRELLEKESREQRTRMGLDGGGGSKQIADIAKNENLPLEVIQLDVNNDKSVE